MPLLELLAPVRPGRALVGSWLLDDLRLDYVDGVCRLLIGLREPNGRTLAVHRVARPAG